MRLKASPFVLARKPPRNVGGHTSPPTAISTSRSRFVRTTGALLEATRRRERSSRLAAESDLPSLFEALRHFAVAVDLHVFDLHAGHGIPFQKGDPSFRVLVDPGHLAGLAFLEASAGRERPFDRVVNVIDREAGVMEPFAMLRDVAGKAVVRFVRLAKLNLNVAEKEVRLPRAGLR